MNCLRNTAWLFVLSLLISQSGLTQVPSTATSASPELVSQLTKGLSITPTQATGGAGALFGLAKSRLSPADFSKVAEAVPGMNSFLKAAPTTGGTSELSGLTNSLRVG